MYTCTHFPEIINVGDCPESTARFMGGVQKQVAHDLGVVVHGSGGHSKGHWNNQINRILLIHTH